MPNIVKLLLGGLVVAIVILLYLYRFSYYPNQTPLEYFGYTHDNNRENIVLRLENKGISNIKIKRVIVNKNEEPTTFCLLNVLKQDYLMDGPIEGNYEDYLLPHSKNLDNRRKELPYIQYGLYISNDTPIHNFEIEYYYLGVIYNLTRTFNKT